MTSLEIRPRSARHHVPPEYTPRLKLRPKGNHDDYIDGAWWPRSGELATELPDLLAVLSIRLGPVQRVVYDPGCWSRAPKKTTVRGHTVELAAYPFHLRNTLYAFGTDGAVVVLRVIPSATDDDTAHTELMAAVTTQPAANPAGWDEE
jgi:hypothetical protein